LGGGGLVAREGISSALFIRSWFIHPLTGMESENLDIFEILKAEKLMRNPSSLRCEKSPERHGMDEVDKLSSQRILGAF